MDIDVLYEEDCVGPKGMCQLPDNSVDMILCDPPYGIDYEDWDTLHSNQNSALGGVSPAQKSSSFKRRSKPIAGWSSRDKLIGKEYQDFCYTWLIEVERIAKEGSPIIIFNSRRLLHHLCIAMEEANLLVRDILIWEKSKANGKAQKINKVLDRRGELSKDTLSNYRIGNLKPLFEPFIWGMKRYSGAITDCVLENGVGGFMSNNESEIKSNIFKYDIDPVRIHPTQKPMKLFQDIISTFTLSSESIVLDLFMGSGTTAIACMNTNRHYIGYENDPEMFVKMTERIENHKKGLQNDR